MQDIALFYAKIYTAGQNSTRPVVVTVVTNIISALEKNLGKVMFLVCLKIPTFKIPKKCWTSYILNLLMKKFSCHFDASPSKDRLIESTLPQEISICAFVAFSFQVVFTETFMQNSEWLSYDDTKYCIHQFENVSIETFMHDHLKHQRKLLQTLQAHVSNVDLKQPAIIVD